MSQHLCSLWIVNTMALLAAHEGDQHSIFCHLDDIVEYEPRQGENVMSDVAVNAVQGTYVCRSRHTLVSESLSGSLEINTNVIVGAYFNLPSNLDTLQSPPVYLDKSYPPTRINRISSGTGHYFAIHFQYAILTWQMSARTVDAILNSLFDICDDFEPTEGKWRKDLKWEARPKWESAINWNCDPANDERAESDEESGSED